MRKIILPCLAASLFIVGCGTNNTATNTAAEEKKDTAVVADDTKTEIVAPPDSATMMKNWMAYMTPAAPHEMMAKWSGTWTGDITMWQAPGAPPQTSKGTVVYKMIMGNRYQLGNYSGQMMGQAMEGMSTLAYDNAKKLFVNTWIDNMGTGLMKMEGPWDETTKTLTLAGKGIDPTAGSAKEIDMREVLKVIDDNTQLMEMYGPGPDGKEFKMMEIKYTRKK